MKLTYQDCVELTNAGWTTKFQVDSKHEVVNPPTLSELIEACGEEFEGLDKYEVALDATDPYYDMHPEMLGTTWHASGRGEEIDMSEFEEEGSKTYCVSDCCGSKGHGSSPEQSVKNLWIALQK